jgi:hypothetical protein
MEGRVGIEEPGYDRLPGSYDGIRSRAQAVWRQLQEEWARTQAISGQRRGAVDAEFLRESAFARLVARANTMPIIEQAKGILMAQQGCGPEEAFDLLRRASQRSNIPVRDLAAQIISNARTAPRPAVKLPRQE